MRKIIISLIILLFMTGCSGKKPQEPTDEYSDEKLKEHGFEIVYSDVKLDFSKNIINAVEIIYSDKEGEGRGFALIDDKYESSVAVFDRMFEEGNYFVREAKFKPAGIMASALVDEEYIEYRPYEMLKDEIITLYISYDDFDIANNLTSYDLGFCDDQYRSKLFLTVKKDNLVYLQKAQADEMMGDFQSISLEEEYPVFETSEKIGRMFASRDVLSGKIWEKCSAILITDESLYLGYLSEEDFIFKALDYLSGLRERIHFITIDRDVVTIVLKDGKVLRTDVGKLN